MNTRPHHAAARRGFTLIELTIAIALSALIMLLLATAVGTGMDAMRTMQRVADENRLLRSGWLLAMDDADFWRSHADPSYPYLRGELSEDGSGPGVPGTAFDKRPFRAVDTLVAAQASSLHPHDPRSWYRGSVMAGTEPRMRVAPDWDPALGWLTSGDPLGAMVITSGEVEGAEKLKDKRMRNIPMMPAGWAPWHITGDYAAMGNVTKAGSAQAVQQRVFEELGHLGVAAYMPPGSPNLVMRPAGNRSRLNIGKTDTWYDWGEIPWALSAGSSGAAFSPTRLTVPPAPSGTQEDRRLRGNYLLGMPTRDGSAWYARVELDDNGRPMIDDEGFLKMKAEEAGYTDRNSAPMKVMLCDLDRIARRRRGSSIAGVFAARALPGVEVGSWDLSQIDDTVLDPFRRLDTDAAALVRPGLQGSQVRTEDRMRKRFTLRTSHVPQAATDQDVPAEQTGAGPLRLETTVFRALDQGDRVWCAVAVRNAATGARYEFSFAPLGSDFRGARQHWGLVSKNRPGWKRMGDRND